MAKGEQRWNWSIDAYAHTFMHSCVSIHVYTNANNRLRDVYLFLTLHAHTHRHKYMQTSISIICSLDEVLLKSSKIMIHFHNWMWCVYFFIFVYTLLCSCSNHTHTYTHVMYVCIYTCKYVDMPYASIRSTMLGRRSLRKIIALGSLSLALAPYLLSICTE